MTKQQMIVRKNYCTKNKLCFISLKPLKPEAILIKQDFVDMVFVNPEFSKSKTGIK